MVDVWSWRTTYWGGAAARPHSGPAHPRHLHASVAGDAYDPTRGVRQGEPDRAGDARAHAAEAQLNVERVRNLCRQVVEREQHVLADVRDVTCSRAEGRLHVRQ